MLYPHFMYPVQADDDVDDLSLCSRRLAVDALVLFAPQGYHPAVDAELFTELDLDVTERITFWRNDCLWHAVIQAAQANKPASHGLSVSRTQSFCRAAK